MLPLYVFVPLVFVPPTVRFPPEPGLIVKFRENVTPPPYYPEHPLVRQEWARYLNSVSGIDRRIVYVYDMYVDDEKLSTVPIDIVTEVAQHLDHPVHGACGRRLGEHREHWRRDHVREREQRIFRAALAVTQAGIDQRPRFRVAGVGPGATRDAYVEVLQERGRHVRTNDGRNGVLRRHARIWARHFLHEP